MSDQPVKKKTWSKRSVKLNLDKMIHINCASAERAAWIASAGACGMPLHVWMRCILDAAAGVSPVFIQLQQSILETYLRRGEHMLAVTEPARGESRGRRRKKDV